MNIEKAFISERAELTILEFLLDEISLSKKKLKDCLFKGGVWIKRAEDEPFRVRATDFAIKEGDEIHIYYDEHYLKLSAPKLLLQEQHQDISIWVKPEGISESISLYSDHLNFDRCLELSLPKDQDCHLMFPLIAYCDGPVIIAHSRHSASKLQQWIDTASISFDIEGKANQELYDFIADELSSSNIRLHTTQHNAQKSPKLQHTSGTINFEITGINSESAIEKINHAFLVGFEEYDDGRTSISMKNFKHPL
ncbi:MAG: hypothetical protein KAG18_08080 [Sinobacterium sp.]|nr:hypothetical protein [Sinobacterium sp.]